MSGHYIFASEFDAVVKQVEDLFFPEARLGFGRDGGGNDGLPPSDGGGACCPRLCPFKFVVVGADCERALQRGKRSSLLRCRA